MPSPENPVGLNAARFCFFLLFLFEQKVSLLPGSARMVELGGALRFIVNIFGEIMTPNAAAQFLVARRVTRSTNPLRFKVPNPNANNLRFGLTLLLFT